MRDWLRAVRTWVVVLAAIGIAVSAGVLGLTAGRAPLQIRSGIAGSPGSPRPLLAADFSQDFAGELTSPNVEEYGQFGESIAASGSIVVVGAPLEGTGHAYTFNAKTGALIATLTSPNPATGGEFGYAVAISGSTVVVGAPGETGAGFAGAGHAYTFNAKTGALGKTFTSPNAASFTDFGQSVAVSGSTAVVGAPFETASGESAAGHAYTFDTKTGALTGTLTSPNAQSGGSFGWSVGVGGTTVLVGAIGESVSGESYAGHAYLFNAKTGALISTLSSPNSQTNGEFGFAAAVSGSTAVVGAAGEGDGHAYTFNAKTGAAIWTFTSPNPVSGGSFGCSVAVIGATVAVGAYGETASGDTFAGHAYTFGAKTGALIATFGSPNPQASGDFGDSVAVSSTTVIVGAPFESAYGLTHAGQAYLM